MNINTVLLSVCENVTYATATLSTGAYSAAEWMGRTVSVIGQGTAQFAQTVTQWATPFFAAMGSFLSQYQGSIGIALIGVTVGAIGATVAIAAASACNPNSFRSQTAVSF